MIQIIAKKGLKLKEIKDKIIKLYKSPAFRSGVRKGFFVSSSFIFVFQISKAPVFAIFKQKNTLKTELLGWDELAVDQKKLFGLKRQKYWKTWFSVKEWRSYFKSGLKSSPEYKDLVLNIKEHTYPFLTGSFFGIVFGTFISYVYAKLNYAYLTETNSLK